MTEVPGVGGPIAGGAVVRVPVVPGALTGLTGPSGSGKTTLIYGLAGHGDAAARVDGSVALILQSLGLVGVLTAHETVALPLQARGLERSDVAARSVAALEALGLGDHGAQLVGALSGGQRQRVAVARALAAAPDVLLADEPTAALDEHWRDQVLGLLVQLARDGSAVVIASADPTVLAVCDEVITLAGR